MCPGGVFYTAPDMLWDRGGGGGNYYSGYWGVVKLLRSRFYVTLPMLPG